MKRMVRFCDKCKGQIPDGQGFLLSLWNDRRMDLAGSSEDWHLEADICPKCLVTLTTKALGIVAKKLTKSEREDFCKEFGAVEV